MTAIQRFIEVVASSENSRKCDLVDKPIRKLVDLIDDASDFIVKYEGEDKRGMPFYTLPGRTARHTNLRIVPVGRILKATSAREKVQEFKSNLDQITKEFERALAATVYERVMTAAEEAECIKISNWLTSLDFVGRLQDIISRHAPGTGAWFLERDDIRNWMNGRLHIHRLWV